MTGSWVSSRRIFKWFHLLWEEEKAMAGHQSLVPWLSSRVVIQGHNKIESVLEILLDDFDPGRLPDEHEIERIGQCPLSCCSTSAGLQAHAVSSPDLFAG